MIVVTIEFIDDGIPANKKAQAQRVSYQLDNTQNGLRQGGTLHLGEKQAVKVRLDDFGRIDLTIRGQ